MVRSCTTKQIPVVVLGVMENGLSWEQSLMLQKTTRAFTHPCD